ncbi:hypothetical protein [Hyphomicrobium sp.]|uniref:hypothetical protein n=1 Tax=Hyphomicrobium sp. TaxID=82 RepID=UPI002D041B47|nr:hypothetical protein [Hyphomicrobium sp.]HRQ25791.1 hypothetical protein [Hyphomicrobium sp.]
MPHTSTVRRLVRVPSAALGRILDQGKDAAHAAKLFAIKSSKGPTFALNEKYCLREYGVSRRAFQAGIKLARRCGALDRRLRGRQYAIEQPLDDGSGRFVLIDESLLTQRSALVAFVLAVNLSPGPVRPETAAGRIGVKSPGAVRKLHAEAADAGAVAHRKGVRGTRWVARRGFDFNLVKNDPVKNDPVKNDPAHREMEGRTQKKEGRTQNTEGRISHATRSSARDGCSQEDFGEEVTASLSGHPEWIALRDWKLSAGVADRAFHANDPIDPGNYMTVSQWREWVLHFAGNVPGHLLRPAAHRQAMEIAHELKSHPEGAEFSSFEIMQAVAVRVARACAEGRTIRSLGFIADSMLRQLDDEDTSSIDGRPSWYPSEEADKASELAWEAVHVFETKAPKICLHSQKLTSTYGIEVLIGLIRKHGRELVVKGMNRALAMNRTPPEGYVWSRWTFIDDDIQGAKEGARRPAKRGRK